MIELQGLIEVGKQIELCTGIEVARTDRTVSSNRIVAHGRTEND